MCKRFKKEFKRRYSYLTTPLFRKVIDRPYKGRFFTINIVQNWVYGKTDIPELDEAFEQVINESCPEALNEEAFEPELQNT